MVMALPVMPILGMPAAGGTARLLVAISSSAVLWWFLGQVVAGRVTKRPVVGWREWLREFFMVGLGLWIGAAGGLLLGVLVLGAFELHSDLITNSRHFGRTNSWNIQKVLHFPKRAFAVAITDNCFSRRWPDTRQRVELT